MDIKLKTILSLMAQGYTVGEASNILKVMKNYNLQLDQEEQTLKEVCIGRED